MNNSMDIAIDDRLIGMKVRDIKTHSIGIIKYIRDGIVAVDFHGDLIKFSFPAAFSDVLELENEIIHQEMQSLGMDAAFESFIKIYKAAIYNEICFLKATGGKKK